MGGQFWRQLGASRAVGTGSFEGMVGSFGGTLRHGGQLHRQFRRQSGPWRAAEGAAQAASKAIWAMEGSRRGSLGLWGQPAGAIGFKGSVGEGTSA